LEIKEVFRQAKWSEPLIYEYSRKGKTGILLTSGEDELLCKYIPDNMIRKRPPNLPSVSEVDVVRHYTRLSQMNWGIDLGVYPLGSCTMKYNPKFNEENPFIRKLRNVHPHQPYMTIQSLLKNLYFLEKWLCEITGMDRGSFQPVAGAHGELAGVLMIRKYHLVNGDHDRNEIIVPDSAHGTNPASASMGGFKVITTPSDEEGLIDIEALKAALSKRTAGVMLTNPNTLGLFERNIEDVSKMVHEVGGLLYYDGANLNGIMGIVRPGDMGFDIVHLNIHKTFSSPHGGGGPGAGVILAKGKLVDFLPVPLIEKDEKGYYFWNYNVKHTIGKIRAFYGNIVPLLKAYYYLLALGGKGIRAVTNISVLNTNYFISLLKDIKGLHIPYSSSTPRKHEVVVSASRVFNETGVSTFDIAKALLDRGVHPPTIYFPLIVREALMIEFTESESKEEIERYAEYLKEIIETAYRNPEEVKKSPRYTSIGRLDEVKASKPNSYIPSYRVYLKRGQNILCSKH